MLLGHYDRPAIDSATLRFASKAFHRGRPTTIAQVQKRFARYGEWAALVLWFRQWLLQSRSKCRPQASKKSMTCES